MTTSFIPTLAVDTAGILGVIERTDLRATLNGVIIVTVYGRELFSGKPWTAVNPRQLRQEDCVQLRKVALWWHDQEAS